MDVLVDTSEAAEMLGLTVHGVAWLRKKNRLTAVKNSTGRVKFRRADVLALKRERDTWSVEKRSA